ncbi:lengsin-like [Clytia hemisphaerica]|uniref:lengsin-like n=1 Tax=Clytia hemisphaerica TaxID=252671 RepID=UPI0034D495EF
MTKYFEAYEKFDFSFLVSKLSLQISKMDLTPKTGESLRQQVTEKQIQLVRLETEDINSVSRGILLDVDYFMENIKEGFSFPLGAIGCIDFDGQPVHNYPLDESTNYSNGALYPDVSTFQNLPWKSGTASVLCHLSTTPGNLNASSYHTRSICKQQFEKLNRLGFDLKSAFEYEFYVVDKETLKPVDTKDNYAATLFNEKGSKISSRIMESLKKIGVCPEKFHMECAPSMFEITVKPSFGIKGADDAIRYRSTVKEICRDERVEALFMTTPFKYEYRSNGQLNHSLWNLTEKTNVFYDAANPTQLSEKGQNWLAGLKAHSKALTCLALPTYNCYQCFLNQEEGFDTGPMLSMNNAWGYDNRTVAHRVKILNESSSYIEYRVPGSAVNPYLITAGLLIAGMDGLKRNLQLTDPPYVGGIYRNEPDCSPYFDIPKTLDEALRCLQEDELFVKELGEEFIEVFVTLKKNEIQRIEEMKKISASDDEILWKLYRNYYQIL